MNKTIHFLSLTVFLALTLLVFFVPSLPYRVAYPTALLVLLSLPRHPRLIALALLCSCVGDVLGSVSFIGQLSAFACCHISLIVFFLLNPRRVSNRTALWAAPLYAAGAVGVCACILPGVHDPVMPYLVAFYALCIISMAYLAFARGSVLLAIGALLFVLSDTLLGWNRFVSHLPQATLCILIPYYAAQALIFLGSRKKGTGLP